MNIPFYHIDAFAGQVFSGNPAGVCPLDEWIDDMTMQQIARENNLSETAFFVPRPGDNGYDIRWFSPGVEIDLCGHATLASAFVIFQYLNQPGESVTFHSKSGRLIVRRDRDMLALDFPAKPPVPAEAPDILISSLGKNPDEVLQSDDWLVVYSAEKDVAELTPDIKSLKGMPLRGVIVTAPGDRVDFVSRFFAPNVGIGEDPVTGSAHCTLIPYWSNILGKKELKAVQRSPRGGELYCTDCGDRVVIAGHAAAFMQGEIRL